MKTIKEYLEEAKVLLAEIGSEEYKGLNSQFEHVPDLQCVASKVNNDVGDALDYMEYMGENLRSATTNIDHLINELGVIADKLPKYVKAVENLTSLVEQMEFSCVETLTPIILAKVRETWVKLFPNSQPPEDEKLITYLNNERILEVLTILIKQEHKR